MKSLSLLFAAAALAFVGTSCKTTSAAAGGEYPEYASDGGYNPYPGSSGAAAGGADQYQQYQQTQQQPAYQQQQYQQYTPPQQSYTPPSYEPEPSYSAPAPKKKKQSSGGGGYTVKKGDTLYRIALNNGVTVSKLKSANGLTSDIIRPGQSLVIP
ncbi:LysM peptidoglycan-binding domain-containing protein [Phragmitibacter flavus]|uniref:LysM peptidoglycan-binding domain-containing protein n=1 Tax=Phragmitibacter flavus TaxID=2576071 RepID=UPI0023F53A08|nr:LysM peptidoglycan-binding domain-containing protein [Phragmitibacter flavus]